MFILNSVVLVITSMALTVLKSKTNDREIVYFESHEFISSNSNEK